ncbi:MULTISPECIES: hypothetical protein [Sphingobacteriaceae]|uniref:DUF1471 domain-containing protein n=1 Tax=Sphingobacterium sp. (strain 21) TaxID=743722 RepID=F4C7M5_SPHS2
MNKKLFLPILLSMMSCVGTSYLGDRFNPTMHMDVYYASKDVKKDYKVIGHISSKVLLNEEVAKRKIVEKAKAVGADGVIIHGIEYTGGEDADSYYKAEAIRYN